MTICRIEGCSNGVGDPDKDICADHEHDALLASEKKATARYDQRSDVTVSAPPAQAKGVSRTP